MAFTKAQRKNSKLRLALAAPSGAGKTWTALQIFKLWGLVIGLLDSERNSALKYARVEGTAEGPGNWDFAHENLEKKSPIEYATKIAEAADEGFTGLIVDSYSHSWMTALEQIDAGGGWTKAGKNVSPRVAKLVDSILSYPGHVIATMRSKTHHDVDKDDRGKVTVKKMGMAPVVRDGTEFEFDIWMDLDRDGTLTVSKSRCPAIPVGEVYTREDIPAIVEKLKVWLDTGTEETVRDKLIARLGLVHTEEDFKKLVKRCQELIAAGKLTKADMAAVRPEWDAKKNEVTGGAFP